MTLFLSSFSAIVVLAAASASWATPAVELSELGPLPTYHVAACPTPVGNGQAHCHARITTDRAGQVIQSAATATGLPNGFGPADLRAAYGVTATGSPRTIVAIVDAYGYVNAESDLAVYRSVFGLPPCTTANGCFSKYNETGRKGPYPKPSGGWPKETALDLDMVSAMCPGCSIMLVEANSSSYADLAAAVGMAASLGARVISNSYGGSELGAAAYAAAYDQPGIAVVASSGDAGYGVQFPASARTVTAVGGTVLKRSATTRGWTETAWKGAGSGCSAVFAKPVWQTDTGCAKRTVADVSAVASPATGVAVYGPVTGGSAWLVVGGTSVAAPVIGGIYGGNGGAVTYGSTPYGVPNGLNDLTAGTNGTCATAYFCTAGVGYDGPTGLGTPRGSAAF